MRSARLPASMRRRRTPTDDYTDIWWAGRRRRVGWGVNFVQTQDVIFATFFVYGPRRRRRSGTSATAGAHGGRRLHGRPVPDDRHRYRRALEAGAAGARPRSATRRSRPPSTTSGHACVYNGRRGRGRRRRSCGRRSTADRRLAATTSATAVVVHSGIAATRREQRDRRRRISTLLVVAERRRRQFQLDSPTRAATAARSSGICSHAGDCCSAVPASSTSCRAARSCDTAQHDGRRSTSMKATSIGIEGRWIAESRRRVRGGRQVRLTVRP